MKRLFTILFWVLLLCACSARPYGDTGTPPNLTLEGQYYWWTELSANSLPAGWVDGGIAEAGSYKGSHYFVHPEYPYWLYVDEDTPIDCLLILESGTRICSAMMVSSIPRWIMTPMPPA